MTLTSCAGERVFHPTIAHIAATEHLTVEAVRLSLRPTVAGDYVVVRLHVSARSPSTVHEARLARAGAANCADGVAADLTEVDGAARDAGPIDLRAPGEVSYWFVRRDVEAARLLRDQPTSIGLALGSGTGPADCMWVPLSSKQRRAEWTSRGAWFVGYGLRGLMDADSVGLGVLGVGRIGRRTGAVRHTVEVQAGRARLAGDGKTGAPRHHDLAAIAPGVDVDLATSERWSFGVGVAYEVVLGGADYGSMSDTQLLHGPRITARVGLSSATLGWRNVREHASAAGIGLELLAWPVWGAGNDAQLVIGLGLVADRGL